jgi:DNA-binding response OmpR family regulator
MSGSLPLILIVEDSPTQAKKLAANLSGYGVRTLIADSGRGGLRAVDENHPDLVVLDINLPDMDGFQVCRRIKRDPATSSIPVVMLTTMDNSSATDHGLKVGADDYIPKDQFATMNLLTTLLALKGDKVESRTSISADEFRFNYEVPELSVTIDDSLDVVSARCTLRTQIAERGWKPSFSARATAVLTALADMLLDTNTRGPIQITFIDDDGRAGLDFRCTLPASYAHTGESRQRLKHVTDRLDIRDAGNGWQITAWVSRP